MEDREDKDEAERLEKMLETKPEEPSSQAGEVKKAGMKKKLKFL